MQCINASPDFITYKDQVIDQEDPEATRPDKHPTFLTSDLPHVYIVWDGQNNPGMGSMPPSTFFKKGGDYQIIVFFIVRTLITLFFTLHVHIGRLDELRSISFSPFFHTLFLFKSSKKIKTYKFLVNQEKNNY